MPRIAPLNEQNASPEQREAINRELQARGRMTNLKWIQAHSPAALRVYGEWFTLKAELSGQLGDRAIFIFCLAISEAQGAKIPVGFFRRALAGIGAHADHLQPDANERLLQRLGTAIGQDARAVPDTLWDELQALFDEVTLVNLVAFAGIMVATTVFANIVQAAPDDDVLPFLKP
jgi:hypothetical protein